MGGEWREVRLGDLVKRGVLAISDGYRVRNEELGPAGIPFVRGGDIGDGWINTTTVDHIRPELAERVRAKIAQADDVAFITKGSVGRAGRLRVGQPPVVFAPQVAYWRILNRTVLDPGFVFYLIKSRDFQNALDGVKTHGSMVADYVSISQQLDFSFRIPDIEHQRAIAHFLGTLDDKIELNRRMNETLEAMARALFKSCFVDFDPVRAKAERRDPGLPKHLADLFPDSFEESELGEIPKGWCIGAFTDVAELLRDQVNPFDEPESEFAHFSIPAFDEGQAPKRERGADIKSLKFCVPPGAVLLSKLNPAIERVWLVGAEPEKRSVCSTEFLVLKARPPFTAAYVYCLARSGLFRQQVVELVTGTSNSHQRAQVSSILGLRVVLPPADAVRALDRALAPLLSRVVQAGREVGALASARDTLLPKLISGELSLKGSDCLMTGRS